MHAHCYIGRCVIRYHLVVSISNNFCKLYVAQSATGCFDPVVSDRRKDCIVLYSVEKLSERKERGKASKATVNVKQTINQPPHKEEGDCN